MENIKSLMQNAGIVGAGGAGFPSYAKIADGAEMLLINGAECEPLIYTDMYLLKTELQTVIDGINTVLDGAGIGKCFIAIKEHTAKRLGLSDWQPLTERIRIRTMPDAYPMGDEINLIYQVTGRVVPPGALPIKVGVIVYNVETVYNVSRAKQGAPLTEKWLTVGGDIKNRAVVKVPIGMTVRDLFATLGITVDDDHIVIDGGLYGKNHKSRQRRYNQNYKVAACTAARYSCRCRQTRSYEIHIKHAQSNCCQCTRCTDMCPRALLGYPLQPHRLVRTVMTVAEQDPEIIKTASLCCGCGICEIAACCQSISPRAVINELKGVLGKNRIKYVAEESTVPSEQRDYRLMPSERWKMLLGVHKMDVMPELNPIKLKTHTVELLLKQSIGAPVTPVVKAGDEVTEGQLIATNEGGLFVPLHSSVNGKVVSVDSNKIVIENREA